jgi:hypothetical protein
MVWYLVKQRDFWDATLYGEWHLLFSVVPKRIGGISNNSSLHALLVSQT